MSEPRFGASALRLCAFAARTFGWRPAEFWTATPAELAAILAPPGESSGVSRDDISRMMEQDHG
ncbi:phage tail assembly chaperone [Novosphingobium sp.]|uniref:phage tail assembly chaperone n=1 Tax=Novosphingobium sp. TaxID=1874826 RepID=UPI00286E3B59|nr:phage tail assembly chaperone [Novosphingobium sp.]